MIWESAILMTLVDLVIVGIAGAALWLIFHSRARLVDPRLRLGETVAVIGVAAIGLFYLADLLTMYVLPSVIGRSAANATMEDLHLNYSWFVILFGVLLVFIGFAHSRRGLFAIIDSLTESEERYRAFVSQSNEGIWRAELEQPMPLTLSEPEQLAHFYQNAYLAECNDAFAQSFGLDGADQAVGLRGGDFYPPSEGQSERILREFVQSDYRVVGQETERAGPDGEIRYYISNITGTVENGMLLRAWGTQQDITRRKRAEQARRASEEKLSTAFRSVLDAITISTVDDGRLVEVNDGFLKISGYEREDVIGRTAVDLRIWPSEERRARFIESVRKQGRIRSAEATFRMRTEEYRDFLLSAELIELDDGPHMLTVATDITERKQAEEALKRSRRRLEQLSRRLITIQETERAHIARELHDEIGQTLTAVKLNLMRLLRAADESSVAENVEDSIAIVDAAVDEVRTLALDLRPSLLDDLGLVAALRWYTDRQASRAGLAATFDADEMTTRPPADIETACFRVAQEAITNVVRHAKAKQLAVKLREVGGELELAVSDDGVGFDVESARTGATQQRMGLVGMQERVMLVGGEFSVAPAPDRGTLVRASFPLVPDATSSAP